MNKYKDPTAALLDGYFLISEKLNNVHVGHIAAILATSRVQDAGKGNYSMPAGLSTGSFASHDSIIAGRSGGAAVLFETQGAWFEILDSHIIKDRHGSILDKMIYIPRAD